VADPAREARLARAIAAIDAANSDDPETLVVHGVSRPKERAHAELMTSWVRRLDPNATDAQLLAARAHHLRRWVVPRSSYPEGRAGYLRWRMHQKRRHADEVATILAAVGYDAEVVARVQQIVRKERLESDPAVQVHEDALCLVFLSTQLDGFVDDYGEDKAVDVVRKTIAKMSERGLREAATLGLSPQGARVVRAATEPPRRSSRE
jgi:hypothetical protein